MEKDEFLALLHKYQEGTATKEETDLLFAYYQLFELRDGGLGQLDENDRALFAKDIKDRLDEIISLTDVPSSRRLPIAKRKNIWYASIAAAVLLVCFVCYWQYDNVRISREELTVDNSSMGYIQPGKDDAILTLADGSKMVLNDENTGVILNKAGVSIEKNSEGEIIYRVQGGTSPSSHKIETPRGGQYRVILSDGTKVWLNAASSIRFPTVFQGDLRRVEITGEVYFEVEEDKNKPFKVYADHQVIEVLGTSFNVNTYPEETSNKTTLLEGKVKITKLDKNKEPIASLSKILSAGQQALLSPINNHIIVESVAVDDAVAWKNGYFKFNREDLQTIMRQVARWYDVDVEYRGVLPQDLFVGEIKRADDIEEVLRILRLNHIKVSVKGRKVIIDN